MCTVTTLPLAVSPALNLRGCEGPSLLSLLSSSSGGLYFLTRGLCLFAVTEEQFNEPLLASLFSLPQFSSISFAGHKACWGGKEHEDSWAWTFDHPHVGFHISALATLKTSLQCGCHVTLASPSCVRHIIWGENIGRSKSLDRSLPILELLSMNRS